MKRSSLLRPRPHLRCEARSIPRGASPRRVAEKLLDGRELLVEDRYGTGADAMEALAELLGPAPREHHARRARERRLREAGGRLFAPIEAGRLALAGARNIGFLEELYPELQAFWLPFPDVQRLSGAWERHRDGVHLAVLGRHVHPYFGTYAPTRTEHLELFATWLSAYEGPRESAIDVGCGCGVLALMLEKAGFERVLATDTNPNAVESLRRERTDRIEVREADLLGGQTAELVVFNPPWLKGEPEDLLDTALYWQPGLFERFFDQALGQRVVLLFSDILGLVQPEVEHPIQAELARGRFRLVQKLRRKVKPTRGRRTKERVEVWELAPS